RHFLRICRFYLAAMKCARKLRAALTWRYFGFVHQSPAVNCDAIFAVASQIARAFHPTGSGQQIGTPRKANQNDEPQWPMKANWHLHRSDGLKSRLPGLLAALVQAKCHPNDSAG